MCEKITIRKFELRATYSTYSADCRVQYKIFRTFRHILDYFDCNKLLLIIRSMKFVYLYFYSVCLIIDLYICNILLIVLILFHSILST